MYKYTCAGTHESSLVPRVTLYHGRVEGHSGDETNTRAAVSRELALKQRLHLQCRASTKVTNGFI